MQTLKEKLMKAKKRIAELELEKQIQVLTVQEFFSNVAENISIVEFYAYKKGNEINIQRLVFSQTSYQTNMEKVVATVKDKYKPKSNKSIRFSASSGGPEADFVGLIGSTGLFTLVRPNDRNVAAYVFNFSYLT